MKKIYSNKKKSNKYKKVVISLASIFLIALAIVSTSIVIDYTGVSKKEPITVDIKQGYGVRAIANALEKEGAIKYTDIFILKAKLNGDSTKFRAGKITIAPKMSYDEIIKLLTKENRNTTKVVIPEGYEIRQIADTLEKAGVINREKFISELDPTKYDYKFLKDLPKRDNMLEGYLFPDTYYIEQGDTEHDIINMMLSEFDNRFKEEYYTKARQMGMTVDQIVTLASIIERETDVASERAIVSGVFYNRIRQNMKLQSCATVQYILKERKSNLSVADTKIKSPYNTYINNGLPIGPIASPGIDCIIASLNPQKTDALYFVMGKDGKHIFSKTYEEHIKAKKDSGLYP